MNNMDQLILNSIFKHLKEKKYICVNNNDYIYIRHRTLEMLKGYKLRSISLLFKANTLKLLIISKVYPVVIDQTRKIYHSIFCQVIGD